LCGASRPGHFRGVATVVLKLFNLVVPTLAVFGSKDYQQARVVAKMVGDLDLPVEVVTAPIVREPDGLAMSSRNRYLSGAEREQALCLFHALERARALFAAGERSAAAIIAAMSAEIAAAPSARIDYVEVRDAETLEPVEALERPAVAALAVFIGSTRLIDNAVLGA
ncbi:MAG TPA: pantoate--beta-alanine ligase, partial [bacterium]|nr:pantoate--beta-alanine ligase [bacterium]